VGRGGWNRLGPERVRQVLDCLAAGMNPRPSGPWLVAVRSLKVSALAARAAAVACSRQSSLWLLHLNAARGDPLVVTSPGACLPR
jgi:hypothetical protein